MMKSMCAAIVLLVVSAAIQPLQASGVATVSRFDTPPTLDGEIAPGEWERAVRTTGFIALSHPQGNWLERGMGSAYLGFSEDRLYVALVTELPPDGELVAKQAGRDARLVFQDSFELWLNPYRETEEGWEAGGNFFQIMGNSIGGLGDTKFTGQGAPDKGWTADIEIAHGIHTDVSEGPAWMIRNGVWVAEMSIPFADLGWEGDPTGRPIGVLIARNFKRAYEWTQPTWFAHVGSFVSWFEYPKIMLTQDQPSVHVERLGEGVIEGEIDLKLSIHNPGPARKAKVDLDITSSSMPSIEDDKTIDLPANGTATYAYTVAEARLHADAKHTMTVKVTDADGEQTYFRRSLRIKQRPEFWNVKLGPNPVAAVRLAYYPSYRFIRLRVDPTELEEEAADIAEATVTLTNADGEVLLDKPMTWDGGATTQQFDVGELPDGEYTVTVDLKGYDKQDFTRTFTRIHYPWENNKLGITDEVLPPFTPIKVDGDTLKVVMREHQVGGLGLWESVKARGNETPFKELLAGPIRLVASGESVEGQGEHVRTADHVAVYEGRAEAPGAAIETRTLTEYDGCQRVELTLKPAEDGQPLESLSLEIPLRDEIAPLWHCSTTSLRRNPVGDAPAGEGRVWDSREFPDGEWYGNFKPYIWLGGEERGLAWFADNDRNWVIDENDGEFAPSLELIRKDGVLTLRVNLVQKPVTLDEPRTIVFGLMASPGKPMPENWRKTLFQQTYKDHPTIYWMGSTYWGTREVMAETYPLNGDMSILTKMQEARLTGDPSVANGFIDVWADRHLTGDWPTRGRKLKDKATSRKLAKLAIRRSHHAGPNDFLNVYWEEFHGVSVNHPETRVFGNEWSGGYGIGGMHPLTDSYLDFQCWYGAEFIRRGIGLYFDNTFPKRAYDTLTTNAYRLPDGRIQPSANMWKHREYFKRIWVLHQQLAPKQTPPIMMLHMTNSHILPYMVFNESNLDLEWFYGPEPAQSKYSHDLLRAQTLGLQTGNLPLVLAFPGREELSRTQGERTRFGAFFVHEIKFRYRHASKPLMHKVLNFGYGRDDCDVFNYWHDDYPLEASSDDAKSIVLKRGGDLMIVIATWHDQPETVRFELDTTRLGIGSGTLTNAESGDPIAVTRGAFSLDLPAYGVRILRFESDGE